MITTAMHSCRRCACAFACSGRRAYRRLWARLIMPRRRWLMAGHTQSERVTAAPIRSLQLSRAAFMIACWQADDAPARRQKRDARQEER